MMRLALLILMMCNASLPKAEEALSDFYEHLRYLSERDKVLSQNIASGDTPGYTPKELTKKKSGESMNIAKTNSMHMDLDSGSDEFIMTRGDVSELKPNGNAVNIERELFKKSENATQLHETTSVYNKAKSMINTAIMGHK